MAPMWDRPDKLAHKYYGISPYAYCSGDPINRGDYDGMADYITSTGELINRDDEDNGKLFVLRTSQTEFDSQGNVIIQGISKDVEKQVLEEKDISNLDNFIEITGSQEVRSTAITIIKDNGEGGTLDNNNREYGACFYSDEQDSANVCALKPGPVVDPSKPMTTASISIKGNPELQYLHSHPSGTNKSGRFKQAPSQQDIEIASSHVSYVVGMGDKTVYIYNKDGILGTISLKAFKTYKVNRR